MDKELADASLRRVMIAIFKILSKEVCQGKYPCFPPDKIEIIGRGKIKLPASYFAPDLRTALRLFGATLYYLRTGESEINNESIKLDGYPAIDSAYWPLIQYLLSGNAYDLTQVRALMGGTSTIGPWLKKQSAKSRSWLAAKGVVAYGGAVNFAKIRCGGIYRMIKWFISKTLVWIAVVAAYSCFVYFFYFFASVILISGLLLLLAIVNLIIFDTSLMHWQKRRIRDISAGIFLTLMVFFVFLSPIIGVARSPILVDRRSGEFAARLDPDNPDYPQTWKNIFINLFAYRIEVGLPIKGSIKDDFGTLHLVISYDVKGDGYVEAWEKWHNREALEADIKHQLEEVKIKQKNELAESANSAKTEPEKQIKLEIEADIPDDVKKGIQTMAAALVNQEMKRTKLAMRETKTLNLVRSELTKGPLSQYLTFGVSYYVPPPPPEEKTQKDTVAFHSKTKQ